MNRRGFTFIEMLVVLTIIGILANLAVPGIRGARTRAEAAAVIGDFAVVRSAVLDYYVDHQEWPRSAGWGRVPPSLDNGLPSGFTFRDERVQYRWRYWRGRNRRRNNRPVAALQIRTSDRDLMKAIRNIYQGEEWRGNNRRTTFVID